MTLTKTRRATEKESKASLTRCSDELMVWFPARASSVRALTASKMLTTFGTKMKSYASPFHSFICFEAMSGRIRNPCLQSMKL